MSKWYSKIKRMSSTDPSKEEHLIVHELMNLPTSTQAEEIANKFAEISNQYEPLRYDDIELPSLTSSKAAPLFEPHEIHRKIQKMKKKNSTVPGDIPWRVIREFSVELAGPLSNIYNTCTLSVVLPEVWKFEYITPVPKVSQPQTTDDLRKISGTKNLS